MRTVVSSASAEPEEVLLSIVETASLTTAELQRCEALMTDDERRARDRYVQERDRRNTTVARALVRETLSTFAPVAPLDWRFERNAQGRPFVVPACGLFFNLSHCDGLVALAVSRFEAVGVDVETTDRATDALSLARSQFAPRETAAVVSAAVSARHETFLDFWTLKEAYIKARGLGLAIPLDAFTFEVDLPRGSIGLERTPELGDPHPRWDFRLWSFQRRWRVALGMARAGDPVPVRVLVGSPTSTWTDAQLELRASTPPHTSR